jgi:hypothetical protein
LNFGNISYKIILINLNYVQKDLKQLRTFKKQLFPDKYNKSLAISEQEYNLLSFAFELNLNSETNICILDFGSVKKAEQKKFFSVNIILDKIVTLFKNAYIESSFNGGVHVILKCYNKFVINKESQIINDRILLEFKSKCLVAPSFNYKVENIPVNLNYLYNINEIFSKLNSIFNIEFNVMKEFNLM